MDKVSLSLFEAKQLALKKIYPHGRLVSGREYEHFYAFFTAPKDSDVTNGVFVGGLDFMLCVDKDTKDVFYAGEKKGFRIPKTRQWRSVPINK